MIQDASDSRQRELISYSLLPSSTIRLNRGEEKSIDPSEEDWMRESERTFDDAPIDTRTLASSENIYGRANAGRDPRRSWMKDGEARWPGNAGMRGRAYEKNSSLGDFPVGVKASSNLGLNRGPKPPSEGAPVSNGHDVRRQASYDGTPHRRVRLARSSRIPFKLLALSSILRNRGSEDDVGMAEAKESRGSVRIDVRTFGPETVKVIGGETAPSKENWMREMEQNSADERNAVPRIAVSTICLI